MTHYKKKCISMLQTLLPRVLSMLLKLLLQILPMLLCLFFAGCGSKAQPPVLHVAIPYSETVQDLNSNYYINWLEEKTGLDLEITLIRQSRCEEYLDALFSSEAKIDVVMFGDDFIAEEALLTSYAATGDIYTDDNGTSIYWNYGSSVPDGAGQILWINYQWLDSLGLSMPETTEDLKEVLLAFKTHDMNHNGKADEIALAGAADGYAYSPAEFLLNAFVYNDPWHSRFLTGTLSDQSAACTEEFREGLRFCRSLYAENLLDKHCFDYTLKELAELVNSPDDLVGAFTTHSVSDVIYPGNPEIMARFMHAPPLTGPAGEKHALYTYREPSAGAIITGKSSRKKEASLLLNTMLTEEASLIARYGEEGVDWTFSDGLDVSIYEGASTIVTKNYIWNTSQNKNLNGIGPMCVPEKYMKGVTWNGLNSDTEYIDARAQMTYQSSLPDTSRFHVRDEALSEYVDRSVEAFIRGTLDIESEEVWTAYLEKLKQYY